MSNLAPALVADYRRRLREVERVEEELTKKKAELRRLLEETIPVAFDVMEMTQMKYQDGDELVTVTIEPFTNSSIRADRTADAYAWIRDRGDGSIIKKQLSIFTEDEEVLKKLVKFLDQIELEHELKEGIHFQTLQKYVRELDEEGLPITDAISVYRGRKAKIKTT